MLEFGEGVKANPDVALRWYKRAAAQDHEEAAQVLKQIGESKRANRRAVRAT